MSKSEKYRLKYKRNTDARDFYRRRKGISNQILDLAAEGYLVREIFEIVDIPRRNYMKYFKDCLSKEEIILFERFKKNNIKNKLLSRKEREIKNQEMLLKYKAVSKEKFRESVLNARAEFIMKEA